MREIKKYVAFNPSDSETDAWWTTNTLKEMSDMFYTWGYDEQQTTIKKICDGRYKSGYLEIYDTTKNEGLIKEIKSWYKEE